jgi:hypothetical protein
VGAGLDPDFLREAVRVVSALLMELEVKQQIGADRLMRLREASPQMRRSSARSSFFEMADESFSKASVTRPFHFGG